MSQPTNWSVIKNNKKDKNGTANDNVLVQTKTKVHSETFNRIKFKMFCL